jgi:hypothetical protein
VSSTLKAYQVGTYKSLKALSVPGDGLVIHHVGQGHAMAQVVQRYVYEEGPAIAIPTAEHLLIPNLRGEFTGSARGLLARDVRNLRNYTGAPNSSINELIERNRRAYPGAFAK